MYNNYSLYIFNSHLDNNIRLYSLINDLTHCYIFNDISDINTIFDYFKDNDINFKELAVICQDPFILYSFSRQFTKYLLDNF